MPDTEIIEDLLADRVLVKNALGMDFEAYKRYKYGVAKGLIKFGSSFAYHLGLLLNQSDIPNSVKILLNWQNLCSEHEMLYRIWKAKQDAEN